MGDGSGGWKWGRPDSEALFHLQGNGTGDYIVQVGSWVMFKSVV